MTQPQTEFLDLYKAGLKTAADLMKASLQTAERLQNQQLVVIRNALDQQSKSINELSQVRSLDELLSVQGKLWSELYQTQITQAQNWFSEMNSAQGAATAAATTAIRQASPRQQDQQQHRKSA
jgi:CRISPR/Cas system-associated endonuclease Cas1